MTTTVTTTTTTMTTTTTSAECIETWTSRVGVNSVGGQPQAGLTTLSQCQAACIANYQCVAVDWNSRPRPGEAACWIHTNANRRHFATPGVTQYELTKRCTSPPTTTETRQLDLFVYFTTSSNSNSSGGGGVLNLSLKFWSRSWFRIF